MKLKEALGKTITFAKTPDFDFVFVASIVFQPRSHPQLSTWRTIWEDVGGLETVWETREALEGFKTCPRSVEYTNADIQAPLWMSNAILLFFNSF